MIAYNNAMKLDEINVLVAEYNFAVICLTETWLDNSIDANSILLICYRGPFRLDRNRHGGGVLAYVKNNIYCVRRFDFESPDVEILWLEIFHRIPPPHSSKRLLSLYPLLLSRF